MGASRPRGPGFHCTAGMGGGLGERAAPLPWIDLTCMGKTIVGGGLALEMTPAHDDGVANAELEGVGVGADVDVAGGELRSWGGVGRRINLSTSFSVRNTSCMLSMLMLVATSSRTVG